MRVLRVGRVFLMPLVENNVVSLVDSGAVDTQPPQSADYHLRMFVAREVAAGTCNAPIEVALVMEDGAST